MGAISVPGGISGGYEWYTPPEIFAAMGAQFDLDVASPGADIVPWIPATRHLTRAEDGLRSEWEGYVWMNCPFGELDPWIKRFVEHKNGVAILPDLTFTRWWHRATDEADLIMFVRPRIHFLPRYGVRTNSLSVALVAMGELGVLALLTAELKGRGKTFWRSRGR